MHRKSAVKKNEVAFNGMEAEEVSWAIKSEMNGIEEGRKNFRHSTLSAGY